MESSRVVGRGISVAEEESDEQKDSKVGRQTTASGGEQERSAATKETQETRKKKTRKSCRICAARGLIGDGLQVIGLP